MIAIVPAHNRFDLLKMQLEALVAASDPARTTILVLDNGSRTPIAREPWIAELPVSTWRTPANCGNYPVFEIARRQLVVGPPDTVIAFLHSDLLVWEAGWDARVEGVFAREPRLGLIGFVGSDTIETDGGRGLGTVSNFQGRVGGGAALVHGRQDAGLSWAAVVDGCAMIFRRACLNAIGVREGFPPHHFYDRLMSLQALEAGWRVAVLGIACDHLGGQTSVLEPGWDEVAHAWCEAHGIPQPADGGWDLAVYREAERQLFAEYRDGKGLLPVRVEATDGTPTGPGWNGGAPRPR